jgi:hypothetical protein
MMTEEQQTQPAQDVQECRYIRLADRDQYESDGWEVTPIYGFHCQYSHLATREAKHG